MMILAWIAVGIIVVAVTRWLLAVLTGEWGPDAWWEYPMATLFWPVDAVVMLLVLVMTAAGAAAVGLKTRARGRSS
jgi:fluoride ion exporter CrcB/FEX